MSDEAILAIVALLTLIATNCFALIWSGVATRKATASALAAELATIQTQAAIIAVAKKTDDVKQAALAAEEATLKTHAAIVAVAVKTDVVHEVVRGLADAIAAPTGSDQ